VSVTEVDWEDVVRESFGHAANTSAYCLIYINGEDEKMWNMENRAQESFPAFLDKYVIEHNMLFEKEKQDYDMKKQQLMESKHLQTTPDKELIKPAKVVRFISPDSGTQHSEQDMLALPSDAKRAKPETAEDMQIDEMPEIDPLLKTQLEAKIEQKQRIWNIELPGTIMEPRLLTLFHYATQCKASDPVKRAILLQEVTKEEEKNNNLPLSFLGRKEYLQICKNYTTNEELTLINDLYHLFCCVCHHLVQSINEINKNNWCLALVHAIQSFDLNCQICEQSEESFGLKMDLLGRFRSRTLLEVSQLGTTAFTSGEVGTSLKIGNDYIVPSLKAFSRSPFEGDESIVERVREEWCQCLDRSSLTEDDADKLADLLMKIVESDYSATIPDIKLCTTPSTFDTQRLAAQFTNAHKVLSDILLTTSH
jgi:hypothetical protein